MLREWTHRPNYCKLSQTQNHCVGFHCQQKRDGELTSVADIESRRRLIISSNSAARRALCAPLDHRRSCVPRRGLIGLCGLEPSAIVNDVIVITGKWKLLDDSSRPCNKNFVLAKLLCFICNVTLKFSDDSVTLTTFFFTIKLLT